MENIDEIEEIKPAGKKAINAFYDLIKYFQSQKEKIEVKDLLKEIVEKTNYIDYICS
jgi:superfamily I DNA/RNA helicase